MNVEEVVILHVLLHNKWKYVGIKDCKPNYVNKIPIGVERNNSGTYDFYFSGGILKEDIVIKNIEIYNEKKNCVIVTDYWCPNGDIDDLILCNIDNNGWTQDWDINKINEER